MNRDAESLFHELADLSPAQRDLYFHERQVPPGVRAAVESLLCFDEGSEQFLTESVAVCAQTLLHRTTEWIEHSRCGAYRLLHLLGRGGMGSVYLAERADGEVEHRVAIKVLRFGAREGAFRDRFLRERQILATLSHPGIARLLDAGHTGDGQPYLVMDYIDGIPIDVYAAGLDLRGKLALFLKVCDAVSYAHRNLILHRDIKPSNILVDASGEPKLLDFGIAKMLDEPAGQTLTHERLLTPEYASPEQVRGTAQATASDIYSLGAVLYKLLTGHSPHAFTAESRQAVEWAICSAEPPAPGSLNRAIPRDLDCIAAQALRKEPGERYSSADAFAEDIRAFLESRPVRARSGNAWYHTRKFVRRYWMPVAAAALVIVTLSAALFAVDRERAIAQRRFSDVRQLANKLFDIDVQARELAGSTKTRQLIVDTALEYLRRLTADVAIGKDPELALEVGNAYMRVARVQGVPISPSLGQMEPAEKNLRLADGFIQSVLRAEPANRTAMLRAAQISHDRMILAQYTGHPDEALRLARISAAWLDKFNAGERDRAEASAIFNTYLNVADRFQSEDQFDEALRLCNRASALAAALNRPPQRGTFLWVTAKILQQRGDLDQALRAIQESVQLLDPGAAWVTKGGQAHNFQLALVYEGRILGDYNSVSLDRPQEALRPLEHSFRIADEFVHRDLNDHNSRGGLAMAGISLAGILRRSDAARALEVYDHTLGHLAETPGDEHLQRFEITLLAGSSYALRSLGRAADARHRLNAALQRLRQLKMYPADKIDPGSSVDETLQAVAMDEAAGNHLAAAIAQYRELLDHIQAGNSASSIEDAVRLSTIYTSAASLSLRAGDALRASELRARRMELWRAWERKLPDNAFVLRQIAARSIN